jgi:hypothetical protein
MSAAQTAAATEPAGGLAVLVPVTCPARSVGGPPPTRAGAAATLERLGVALGADVDAVLEQALRVRAAAAAAATTAVLATRFMVGPSVGS